MDGPAECISSNQSMQLDLPPSCIEFCPAHPSHFLVGTYNLQKEEVEESNVCQDDAGEVEDKEGNEAEEEGEEGRRTQNRTGSIIVFQLQDGKAQRIQTIAQPSAVFDLHFAPQPDRGDICAAVSSTGTIALFRLSPGQPSSTFAETGATVLQPLSAGGLEIDNLEESTLFTYFAWHPTVPGLMAITTAEGKVIFVQIDDEFTKATALGTPALEHGTEVRRGYQRIGVSERPIIECPMEAWFVAFSNLWDESADSSETSPLSTIFSGGDDSTLRYRTYSLAEKGGPESDEGSDEDDHDSPIQFHDYEVKAASGHNAGVTAILPLSLTMSNGSQVVLTGSYDDTFRVWAITPPHKGYGGPEARVLAEKNLGGGVWRLKVIEELSSVSGPGPWTTVVLASCMHAGTRILRIRGNVDHEQDLEIEVLARFEEHKSMNYGSDYSRIEGTLSGNEGKREVVCVSTSFYDRLLCAWKFEAQS